MKKWIAIGLAIAALGAAPAKANHYEHDRLKDVIETLRYLEADVLDIKSATRSSTDAAVPSPQLDYDKLNLYLAEVRMALERHIYRPSTSPVRDKPITSFGEGAQ